MGCGRVGSTLAHQLEKRDHSVAVIDQNPDAFRRLGAAYGGTKITGIGFDREVLLAAGVEQADAFAAVSSGDNSNIVSARIAREHYHVPKVIARIFDPRRAEIYERLNIPTIASVKWAASQIEFLLFHGKEELKETIGGGQLFIMQLAVPSHLVTKPVWQIGAGGKIRVIGIERGGSGFIPGRDSTFQEGDVMILVVARDALNTLEVMLQPVVE